MRQETLPDPSDRIWRQIEGRVSELDRIREELLSAASWYWEERGRWVNDFETWRLISGSKFCYLAQDVASFDYPNIEKARLLSGLYEREDNRRVAGINDIAGETICYPVQTKPFVARRLVEHVAEIGWQGLAKKIVNLNQSNMDDDFLTLFQFE